MTLDALTKVAAMSMLQTVSEATGTARVWAGAIPQRGGLYALEVYDNETAVPANVTFIDYQPNEDVTGTGTGDLLWQEDDGTTTTIFSEIDETTLDLTDYIENRNTGVPNPAPTSEYTFRVNSASALTGKRILAVELRVYGGSSIGGSIILNLGLDIAGTRYRQQLTVNGYASAAWYYNPNQNREWRIADIQTFDSTDELCIQAGSSAFGTYARVHQAFLRVYYCDENRLAVGTLNDLASALTASAWNAATLTTPTAGTWTKDSSGRHLYLLRRLNSTGQIDIPTLAATAVAPSASGFSPTLDPTYGYATVMGSATPTLYGLIQRTTAPAESVDSQPYVAQVSALVFTGQDAEGEFSSAAVASYGQYRFLVKHGGAPTANLSVKLKRRSDDVQFGTTVTVTQAQIDAETAINGWVDYTVSAGTFGTLAAATQYYIEFSSTAVGTGTDYWVILALDTGNQGNGATFGGTTDRALVNASEADRYDLVATVASIPTTLSGFTVVSAQQTLDADAVGCGVVSLGYLQLDWTSSALASDFGYYEVQRSQDGGSTWDTIALISDAESNSDYQDYETLRNLSAQYRVRVARHSDGAVSAWSSVAGGTIAAHKCELALVSNVDPTLNVAYQWLPERQYEFPNANEAVLLNIYGRDGAVVLLPTEDRLTSFVTQLTVNVGEAPANPGVAVFDPLQALERAQGNTIPYVAVCDHLGNRWFAYLRLPDGIERQRPGQRCVADIGVRELTRTPFVDEVT